MVESFPEPPTNGSAPSGWTVTIQSNIDQNFTFNTFAVCVPST